MISKHRQTDFKSFFDMRVSSIMGHLIEINIIYKEVLKMDTQQLYSYFLHLESQYTLEKVNNYAKLVHMLHPVKYEQDTCGAKRFGIFF